jgi:hypothetical protein
MSSILICVILEKKNEHKLQFFNPLILFDFYHLKIFIESDDVLSSLLCQQRLFLLLQIRLWYS